MMSYFAGVEREGVEMAEQDWTLGGGMDAL